MHDILPGVFVSYAHANAGSLDALLGRLSTLRQEGLVGSVREDRRLRAGARWQERLDDWLATADVVILLLSNAYLESSHCAREAGIARHREGRGEAVVAPILLEPCPWEVLDLDHLQAIPGDGPVSFWNDTHAAWDQVQDGFRLLFRGFDLDAQVHPSGTILGILGTCPRRSTEPQAVASRLARAILTLDSHLGPLTLLALGGDAGPDQVPFSSILFRVVEEQRRSRDGDASTPGLCHLRLHPRPSPTSLELTDTLHTAFRRCRAVLSVGGREADLAPWHERFRRGHLRRPWLPLAISAGYSNELAQQLRDSRYGPTVTALSAWQIKQITATTQPGTQLLFSCLRSLILYSRRQSEPTGKDIEDLVVDIEQNYPPATVRDLTRVVLDRTGLVKAIRASIHPVLRHLAAISLPLLVAGLYWLSIAVYWSLTPPDMEEVASEELLEWVESNLTSQRWRTRIRQAERTAIRDLIHETAYVEQADDLKVEEAQQWLLLLPKGAMIKIVRWSLGPAASAVQLKLISAPTGGWRRPSRQVRTFCLRKATAGWRWEGTPESYTTDGALVPVPPGSTESEVWCATFYPEEGTEQLRAWNILPYSITGRQEAGPDGGSFDLYVWTFPERRWRVGHLLPVLLRRPEGEVRGRLPLTSLWPIGTGAGWPMIGSEPGIVRTIKLENAEERVDLDLLLQFRDAYERLRENHLGKNGGARMPVELPGSDGQHGPDAGTPSVPRENDVQRDRGDWWMPEDALQVRKGLEYVLLGWESDPPSTEP